MWSRIPNTGLATRIIQSVLILIIIISLFHGLYRSRSASQSIASYYTSKHSARFQGILSLPTFNSSNIFGHHASKAKNETEPVIPEARRITSRELLNRSLPVDRTRVPMLIHQSWKDDELPAKFQRWSTSCRRTNPDWEYILWTDEDNYKIIKKYVPWFLKSYKALQSEIYRADAMRNVYMHVFGGVYADLDTECLRPYSTLFPRYNLTTAPYTSLNTTLPPSPITVMNKTLTPLSSRRAFLGRMGTDTGSHHSIPNAWMASTAGHPFWLLPLEKIKTHVKDGGMPEILTGPVSLYDEVNFYQSHYHDEDNMSLDERYSLSGWAPLYPARELESLHILPFWMIYPYSWQRDGDPYKGYCLVGQGDFNAKKCKKVLGLQAWGSWSITYWSHSWDSNGGNHVEGLQEGKGKGKGQRKKGGVRLGGNRHGQNSIDVEDLEDLVGDDGVEEGTEVDGEILDGVEEAEKGEVDEIDEGEDSEAEGDIDDEEWSDQINDGEEEDQDDKIGEDAGIDKEEDSLDDLENDHPDPSKIQKNTEKEDAEDEHLDDVDEKKQDLEDEDRESMLDKQSDKQRQDGVDSSKVLEELDWPKEDRESEGKEEGGEEEELTEAEEVGGRK